MSQRLIPNAALPVAPTPPHKKGARDWRSRARSAVAPVALGGTAAFIGILEIGTTGALNGGTIPPASAFTPLKTWVQTNFLGSDWVLVIGFFALVVLIWGLLHGKGWGGASIVLGILAGALLGPNLVIAAATATRDPQPMVTRVDQTTHGATAAVAALRSNTKTPPPGAHADAPPRSRAFLPKPARPGNLGASLP